MFGLIALGAGALLGAASKISAASAKSKALKAQAAMSEQDAMIALEDAVAEERASRIETTRLISAQRAAAGSQGSAMTGSALLLMSDAAVEGEIEAMGIRRRGELVAGRFGMEAASLRSSASSTMTGGLLGAGASLFSGASSIAGGI